MLKNNIYIDVLIIGGGIAGLWLNARLRSLGYTTILVEHNSLGCDQTLKSQGIIHSGLKYTLNKKVNHYEGIANMPSRWNDCLNGSGEIDLQGVKILSHVNYLVASNYYSKLITFFASKNLISSVYKLKHTEEYPLILKNTSFKGTVYRLMEPVLDVHSLITNLAKLADNTLLAAKKIKALKINGNIVGFHVDDFKIYAKRIVFSAGTGNEYFTDLFKTKININKKPLHMVMIKDKNLSPIYAHFFLGIYKKNPIFTITSHTHKDGQLVWYLGGNIAESHGVYRNKQAQIIFVKELLHKIIPWINLNKAHFSTFRIDRAECKNSYFNKIITENKLIMGWPNKLTLAPKFADIIVEHLTKNMITCGKPVCTHFTTPHIANPIWDLEF